MQEKPNIPKDGIWVKFEDPTQAVSEFRERKGGIPTTTSSEFRRGLRKAEFWRDTNHYRADAILPTSVKRNS